MSASIAATVRRVRGADARTSKSSSGPSRPTFLGTPPAGPSAATAVPSLPSGRSDPRPSSRLTRPSLPLATLSPSPGRLRRTARNAQTAAESRWSLPHRSEPSTASVLLAESDSRRSSRCPGEQPTPGCGAIPTRARGRPTQTAEVLHRSRRRRSSPKAIFHRCGCRPRIAARATHRGTYLDTGKQATTLTEVASRVPAPACLSDAAATGLQGLRVPLSTSASAEKRSVMPTSFGPTVRKGTSWA